MFSSTMAGLAITPVLAPIVHLYFDVFDGLIQLAVFCMLTMINVSSEYFTQEQLDAIKKEELQAKEEKKALKEAKKRMRLEKKLKKAQHA